MLKIRIITGLLSIFLTVPAFAGLLGGSDRPCASIANACMSGGYRIDQTNKRFWQDCMKPVILGQTVSGVNVDPKDVKSCRQYKIQQMKQDLRDFQRVMDRMDKTGKTEKMKTTY